MKKNLMKTMVAVAALSLAMTSCNKSTANDEAQTQPVAPGSLKMAYVEVDSIMSQYKFCKDYSLILQKKGQNIQNTLAARQPLPTSSRRFSRMPIPVSRPRASRLVCRSRALTSTHSIVVFPTSSRQRPISTMPLCATLSSTSSLPTTRTRSIALS